MSATPNINSLLFSALLFSIASCADYPVSSRFHSLDYLELHDPSGWVLRIDGDGGGRLDCRRWPGRRVIYLPATFLLEEVGKQVKKCQETISITSPDCVRAVYFKQTMNETCVCYCPDNSWAMAFFDQAFEEIRNSPAERKDCRILKKAWLIAPPIATSVVQRD